MKSSSRQSLFWASLLWMSYAVSAQDTTVPSAAPVAVTEAPVTEAPAAESSPVATEPPAGSGWQGCEDPVNGKKLVTIGETTTICLNIANSANWTNPVTYMRVNFQPIADQYSRFHVPASYRDLVTDTGGRVASIYQGTNITVHVSSQKSLSFQKKYYDGYEKVFPFLTAIIDVAEGVVKGISWDDSSIFCGPKNQERNTFDFAGLDGDEAQFGQPVVGCFLSEEECQKDPETNTACDLILYVVWTGTDSAGRSFLSSSYRYSAFPSQDWADRVTNNLPDFPELPDMNPLND